MVFSQSVLGGVVEGRGCCSRATLAPGEDAELKFVMITIMRRHNDNNDNDDNPFKVVIRQSLLHS